MDYDMTAEIRIDVDCINMPIQKDEELFFEYELRKLIEQTGMKVKNIYFDR